MGSQRSRERQCSHEMRSLVPVALSSPLGILDISTLQFLLGSSANSSGRQPPANDSETERPASSELARAYGVSSDNALPTSFRSRRRAAAQAKRQRRSVPSKLEPMEKPPSTPAHRRQHKHHSHTRARTLDSGAALSQNQADALRISKVGKNLADDTRYRVANSGAYLYENSSATKAPAPIKSSTSSSETVVALSPTRLITLDRVTGLRSNEDELRREVEWIHMHLPVLRLANAKCSLALRQRLFAETIEKNVLRGVKRLALVQWKWIVAKQRQAEAAKLKAFSQLVEMFERAANDQVAQRFAAWVRYVEDCREMEQHAAAILIQEWAVSCRRRREGRQNLLVLRLARALTTANDNATRIQLSFRVYCAKQKLRRALQAVTKIQRCVRTTHRRRILQEERAATRRREELYAEMRRNEQLQLLTMRNQDRHARQIAQTWRAYLGLRNRLVHACVENLVDQVEFFTAVMSIQSHIRGYQCRFRMKRKVRACTSIQHAWRQYIAKRNARQERKMLLLTRHMAASCLQRTFQRNRERRNHRAVMQKSSRPMFVRALGASASFRMRFQIPIVKSAVSAIQSSWRRHVVYTQWKLRRDAAARRLQVWQRHVRIRSAWYRCAHTLVTRHRERVRDHAARRLQRWLRVSTHRRIESKRMSVTQQLVAMLSSVMTIQRYHRHKRDPWRRILRTVVATQLPHHRQAATTLQRAWRVYATNKRALLAQYDTSDAVPCSLGLHGLQEYLVRQQREMEQRLRAARTIQKAYRQRLARCEGKLLLQRYRVLFQRELRRRQQRQVIHGFLVERQDDRTRRQQARGVRGSAATSTTSSLPAPSSVLSTPSPLSIDSPLAATNSNLISPNQETPSDDPDVVQCWSDEYQCAYWFNSRTGESTWCS